jgi:polar amino acid transport system substrate-binding protein
MKNNRIWRLMGLGTALLSLMVWVVFTVLSPTSAAGNATAGQSQFAQSCASCHGADATGGRGPDLTHIKGEYATVDDINKFISANMPANKPGSLTADQYSNLAQYLAQLNGYTTTASNPSTPAPVTATASGPAQQATQAPTVQTSSTLWWVLGIVLVVLVGVLLLIMRKNKSE